MTSPRLEVQLRFFEPWLAVVHLRRVLLQIAKSPCNKNFVHFQEIRVVSKARSLKSVRERKAQQFRLTPYRERLVAAVYVLSGWDVRLAAQKLREFKGPGSVSDSPTQAERVVEDLYTNLPQDFAMQVWYPPNVSMHRVSMAARAYITESEVFSWVEQQKLATRCCT